MKRTRVADMWFFNRRKAQSKKGIVVFSRKSNKPFSLTKENLNREECMTVMPVDANVTNMQSGVEAAQWFAICTNAKQEDRAYYNLQSSNIECFNPKIKECRRNQFTGAVTYISRPLFPRYIFALFDPERLLRRVSFTRGVLKVVSFNSKPAPIDPEVIEVLQARVGDDGFFKVGEPLKPGDAVRIKDGPWKALVGIVERNIQAGERVELLLTAINYQGRLMIESEWLEKVG